MAESGREYAESGRESGGLVPYRVHVVQALVLRVRQTSKQTTGKGRDYDNGDRIIVTDRALQQGRCDERSMIQKGEEEAAKSFN